MQYNLFDVFDLVVSQSTISKTLHSMKIGRKNLGRISRIGHVAKTISKILREMISKQAYVRESGFLSCGV